MGTGLTWKSQHNYTCNSVAHSHHNLPALEFNPLHRDCSRFLANVILLSITAFKWQTICLHCKGNKENIIVLCSFNHAPRNRSCEWDALSNICSWMQILPFQSGVGCYIVDCGHLTSPRPFFINWGCIKSRGGAAPCAAVLSFSCNIKSPAAHFCVL